MAPTDDHHESSGCGTITMDRLAAMRLYERIEEMELQVIKAKIEANPKLRELIMEDIEEYERSVWRDHYMSGETLEDLDETNPNEEAPNGAGDANAEA
jgi:hypothetical protein